LATNKKVEISDDLAVFGRVTAFISRVLAICNKGFSRAISPDFLLLFWGRLEIFLCG
jgi:hypothetical protein